MLWDELKLISAASSGFRVPNFKITSDYMEWDRRVDRPPYSDTWFGYGSGLQSQGRLSITVKTNFNNQVAAHKMVEGLLAALPSTNTVIWGGYSRRVFGLIGNIAIVPNAFGQNISFSLATRPGDWASEYNLLAENNDKLLAENGLELLAGGEPQIGELAEVYSPVKLNTGSESASLFSCYPSETRSYSRSIKNTPLGMLEVGDLKWLPNSITLNVKALGKTVDDTWASSVKLAEMAKNAVSIEVNGKLINVFGIRKITRKYLLPKGIDMVFEFAIKNAVYPIEAPVINTEAGLDILTESGERIYV